MADDPPTADDLRALLVELLTGATGEPASHWREVVGMVMVTPVWSSPVSNWTVVPKGRAADREAVLKAVEVVRNEQPYARK